jgi:hypothetical protein
MKEQSFNTIISVDATPDQAFAAINDFRGWWSHDIDGSTDTADVEFTFRGKDVHRSRIKVTELVPGERVVWHVLHNYMSFIQDQSVGGHPDRLRGLDDERRHADPLQPRGPRSSLRVLRRLLERVGLLHQQQQSA